MTPWKPRSACNQPWRQVADKIISCLVRTARCGLPTANSMHHALDTFIGRLPKVELHLHLEGAVRPETLLELAQGKSLLRREVTKWISERRAENFRYGDFKGFLKSFGLVTLLIKTPEDYALITTRLSEWLASQNVRYAEVILAAGVLLWKKQPVDEVFDAVERAAREARAHTGVRLQWIFDAVRHFGVEHAREVLRWAIIFRPRGVVGFGIGGDEAGGPAENFVDIYREAREAGLRLTAHAGEAVGPESIRKAVELLGAERIGHGLTAIQDPEVMTLLRDRKIPLEVCPTSNVATGLVPCFEEHPLPHFLEAGLAVTLNSDDPAMFGTSLQEEFVRSANAFSFSRKQIIQLSENAIRYSFLPGGDKELLLRDLRDAASATESG